MLVGGLGTRLAWDRVDMLVSVDVNAVIGMIDKCDDLLHFDGIAGLCEKGEQVSIDSRQPALDVGYSNLHVAGMQANVIRCIGLRSSQGSVCCGQGKIAVAQYAKAIPDILDILQGAERGERLVVRAMVALDDVYHTLGCTLSSSSVVTGHDALQDLRLGV